MATVGPPPLNSAALRDLRQLAVTAARAAGAVARRYFDADYEVRLKADRSEVSVADEAAQAAAITVIRTERPADAFLTEEDLPETHDAPPPANDRITWVIDPIDGTRNYVRHIPLYASAVAAMLGGVPMVGAIYHVDRDVLYAADSAAGLFINDHAAPPLNARERRAGVQSKPVVGIPSAPHGPLADRAHHWLKTFVCRNLGATSLHLALVASGQLDGMFADNPKLWDLAAGWVMITAVGGRMTSPTGQPIFPLDVTTYHGGDLPTIAGHPALHARLLQA
jgi:myo-inositol-1(or 4)-monophosphatase